MTDIQKLDKPEHLRRVETGVVQFGDDWPGYFIRGDNAMAVALDIEMAIKRFDITGGHAAHLLSLAAALRTVDTRTHGETDR